MTNFRVKRKREGDGEVLHFSKKRRLSPTKQPVTGEEFVPSSDDITMTDANAMEMDSTDASSSPSSPHSERSSDSSPTTSSPTPLQHSLEEVVQHSTGDKDLTPIIDELPQQPAPTVATTTASPPRISSIAHERPLATLQSPMYVQTPQVPIQTPQVPIVPHTPPSIISLPSPPQTTPVHLASRKNHAAFGILSSLLIIAMCILSIYVAMRQSNVSLPDHVLRSIQAKQEQKLLNASATDIKHLNSYITGIIDAITTQRLVEIFKNMELEKQNKISQTCIIQFFEPLT